MADVEVGLHAVLGHEHLAVLEGAHRARVDVQVGVELLHLDGESTRLEQAAERSRDDALTEGRDDASGDEDVLGRARAHCPLLLRSWLAALISKLVAALLFWRDVPLGDSIARSGNIISCLSTTCKASTAGIIYESPSPSAP